MTPKKCPKCNYVRQPSDENVAPDWQCPKCRIAYNKMGKLPQASKEAKPDQLPRGEPSPSSPRLNFVPILLSAIIAGVMGAAAVKLMDRDESHTRILPERRALAPQDTPSNQVGVKEESARISASEVELQKGDIGLEISRIEARLAEAQAEYQNYTGGLIKSVLGVTIATQQQTIEMLKQRQGSWTFGIGLKYTVDGKSLNLPQNREHLITELERDIASAQGRSAEARAEADRYTGGLIRATQLAAHATGRQTVAMLEQKRVALKYGLPQFVGFSGQFLEIPSGVAENPDDKEPVVVEERDWELVEIDSKVTESNSSWWKYAWKLTLKSSGTVDRIFQTTIEFQDADGFIVDSDREYDLVLKGGTQKTFTGSTLIRVPGARNVAQTYAKVSER